MTVARVDTFKAEPEDEANINTIRENISQQHGINLDRVTKTAAIKIALEQTAKNGFHDESFLTVMRRKWKLALKKLEEDGWVPRSGKEVINFMKGIDGNGDEA